MKKKETIPNYRLYGEEVEWSTPEPMHSELIKTRCLVYDWEIKPHRHDRLTQIIFLSEGGGTVSIDDVLLEVEAPCAILVPALTVHGFEFSAESNGVVISVFNSAISKILERTPVLDAKLSDVFIVSGKEYPDKFDRLTHLFNEFHSEYSQNDRGKLLSLESTLALILVGMYRLSTIFNMVSVGVQCADDARVNNLMRMIDTHYKEHKSVSYYAQKLHLTRSKLNSITQKMLNLSPHDLITTKILLEAKRHILYTSMSYSQIAGILGFKDPSYFSRFFKKHTGDTPAEFRINSSLSSFTEAP